MKNKALAQHYQWDAMPKESLDKNIERRIITGAQIMIGQLFLKEGTQVAKHQHHNEQITYILKGALKLLLGEHEDQEIIVRAGEVLVIPPNLPHSAVALEDTLDIDVFNPPRQDWLEGTDHYLRDSASL